MPSRAAAVVALAVLGAACPAPAPRVAAPSARDVDRPGVSLAIYSNLAVVREVRELELGPGAQPIAWGGVATQVQGPTLRMVSLTDPEGTRAGEQTVDAPITSGDALLARSVGRPIALRTRSGEVRGTLRAYDAAQIAIDVPDGGLRLVPRGEALESFSLGGDGIAPTATARWVVDARRPGRHLVEVTYDTIGLAWDADYLVILEDDGATSVELSGWATIRNDSGVTYRDAWIQLSTVNPLTDAMAEQARQLAEVLGGEPAPAAETSGAGAEDATPLAGVGPATLPDRQSTRVALVAPRAAVPSRRRLVYDPIGAAGIWREPMINMSPDYGASDRPFVDEFLELTNDVASGLGRPLPAGRARVFTRRQGGALGWVGESELATAKVGDRLRLRLGPARGVRGERKQVEFTIEADRKRIVEEVEIAIENTEETPREVLILERLARGDTWRVSWSSTPVEKEDARTIRAVVTVPPLGTERLRYRVIYTWR
jgi:hypothetical protein